MSIPLYQMTEEYLLLLAEASQAEDPDEVQAFADTLEGLTGEIGDKLEGCACVVRSLEGECTAFEDEIKRMQAKLKSKVNAIASIKNYMKVSMDAIPMTKHIGKLHTIAIQANAPSVVVSSEKLIPVELMRTYEPEPDKVRIKEILKAGGDVPGCSLETGSSLRIR